MPRSTGVCRVEELLASSDCVCAVGRVFVVVKCQESFSGVVLDPTVSFVTRLPERVVGQANEDGLNSFQRHYPIDTLMPTHRGLIEVCKLDHGRWEFELYGR